MRQAISFVIAGAILIGGLWLLYTHLTESPVIRGRVLMTAGLLIAVGAGWLFGDFVLPRWRKKVSD